MFCSNCGKQIKDDDIFCNNCGLKIEFPSKENINNNSDFAQGNSVSSSDRNQADNSKIEIGRLSVNVDALKANK